MTMQGIRGSRQPCIVEDCDGIAKGYGYCSRHYQRWVKYQDARHVPFSTPRVPKTHCKHGHEFTPENTRLTKLGERVCIACSKAASARYHQQRKYLVRYGLTIEDFDRMMVEQDGKCALCLRAVDYRLFVDHDHETGRVRGLLCSKCNGALGWYQKRRALIERYIDGE